MKLIGVNIFQDTLEGHRKSLAPGWYPFVNAKAPAIRKAPSLPIMKDSIPRDFFRKTPSMPEVSISCIVGLNGSGKSTLIELILKIINNFSVAVFGGEGDMELLMQSVVLGINADLYLQIDDYIYCIRNVDRRVDGDMWEVKLFLFDQSGNPDKIEIEQLDYDKSMAILSKMCYTICVNYGLHSFNSRLLNSFEANRKDHILVSWFDRIFHRIDNYRLPLTIVPSRNDGVIDINGENKLTKQRMAVISLLLYSKGQESILKGYSPSYIRYQYRPMEKEGARKLYKRIIEAAPEPDGDLLDLFDPMYVEWKSWIDRKITIDLTNDGLIDHLISYLTLESLKIAIANNPHVEYIKQFLYQGLHDYPQNVDAREICAKVVIGILNDDSHLTVNIHTAIRFFQSDIYHDKWEGRIEVKDLLKETNSKTYFDIIGLLPPDFYHYECYFSTHGRSDLTIDMLSSGERQFLFTFSAVLFHLASISRIAEDDCDSIPFRHVNLIFDEIELYFHPEYQRSLIESLITAIAMLGLDTSVVKSINILLATHSPFILSDIPASNVLYLGPNAKANPKTFGANIYDSLKDGFFMKGTMGCWITDKIRNLFNVYYNQNEDEQEEEFVRNRTEFKFLSETVEDEYLKGVLKRFYDELSRKIDNKQRG